MSLKAAYTLLAPFYDAAIGTATRAARRESLQALPKAPSRVLLVGVGTGLDLPYLPEKHQYIGLDLTWAMLRRALPRVGKLDFTAIQGDAQRLPLASACVDAAVLHLIVAVVPDPVACLREAARVVRPGGRLLVFDKFLHPDQKAPLRRLITPLAGRLATRLDVVWEEVLAAVPQVTTLGDEAALAGGWFRRILLQKT